MTPSEWLLALGHDANGHRRLLASAGSLAAAAWRLAVARCRSAELSTDVPSALELRGAAREIARRCGLELVPSAATLARDCLAAGLPVV